MRTEQARAMHLACDFLYAYLGGDGEHPVPSDAQFAELTVGNFLASEAVAGMLAALFEKTVGEVVGALPERDEGYPPGPASTPGWDTTIDELRRMRAYDWQIRPGSPGAEAVTGFRASFNLFIALNAAFAVATNSSPRMAVELLRDAAAADM